jgi:2-keto-myo-inositol isomerase
MNRGIVTRRADAMQTRFLVLVAAAVAVAVLAPGRADAHALELTVRVPADVPEITLLAAFDDGTPAKEVGAAARSQDLVIRSINALQRFEQFDAARESEAKDLIRYAVDSGTQALVLCPTNSRQDSRTPQKRHADLVNALGTLKPLLDLAGLVGLVEPLGFEEYGHPVRKPTLRVAQ